MSLDKAIKYKKEKRKQYKNSAKVDKTCRNNNSCSWCRNNRTHSSKLRLEQARYKEKDEVD